MANQTVKVHISESGLIRVIVDDNPIPFEVCHHSADKSVEFIISDIAIIVSPEILGVGPTH